jgi:transposase InsO family protein/transposase
MPPTEDFGQLRLKFTDPVQHHYEVIRPIVLFSETISERSRQTGVERTQVGEKAKRFIQKGMFGLVDQRTEKGGRKPHEYPEPIAEHILYLKQLYPPIHYREIVRIIERKFGYQTNHHTVKSFLERYQFPVQLELEFPTFHSFEDAYQARWTVVQMYFQGWNRKSIAVLLKLSHQHVGRIIDAFEQDGFAALEDKRTRPINHPHNQMSLPFIKEVLDTQKEYPRAGRFRVHGILENRLDDDVPSERTVGRAMALNREFHGAPGPWQSDRKEADSEAIPKYLPYRPQYRHQMWCVDLRYLVKLKERWVYSICVIEGYSRTILAGMASEYKDLASVLQILYAALSQYGCPEVIVSDNDGVFTSPQTRHLLEQLQVEPKYIEKGKPWENLIESQFKVQLRLADHKFETAKTFEDIQERHTEFIETFNTTPHWAHKEREDGRRTPIKVLAWVRGREVDLSELQHLFQAVRFDRTVNRYGFVSIQRYYLYAEQGLSRKRVSIWIYEGKIRIEYQQTMLAKYVCDYDQHQKQLQAVSQPTLFQTSFKSPQLVLFELDDEQWLKIRQRAYHRRQQRFEQLGRQLPLLPSDIAA